MHKIYGQYHWSNVTVSVNTEYLDSLVGSYSIKKKKNDFINNIGHLFAIRHNMQISIGFSARISISVQSQINSISANKAISLKQACNK